MNIDLHTSCLASLEIRYFGREPSWLLRHAAPLPFLPQHLEAHGHDPHRAGVFSRASARMRTVLSSPDVLEGPLLEMFVYCRHHSTN